MAEVLGADREYFLFDSFQGHRDPQPIDGPAALAWKEDKDGPWYFDNAVVGTEDAEGAMLSSGAKSFKLVSQRLVRRYSSGLGRLRSRYSRVLGELQWNCPPQAI